MLIEITSYNADDGRSISCVRAQVSVEEIPEGLLDQMAQRAVDSITAVRERAASIKAQGLKPRVEFVDGPRWVDPVKERDLLGLCFTAVENEAKYVYFVPVVSSHKLN